MRKKVLQLDEPTDSQLCSILQNAKTIAVVGISRYESKTSRQIAEFLVDNGYNVAGVNPAMPNIEGISVYKSLTEIPFKVDIVDVFRRSEYIPDLIDDVIKIQPKVFWLQLGIRNDEAVKRLIDQNITVVQDTCIAIQHNHCF
jgi:predicted CoA-binding protein